MEFSEKIIPYEENQELYNYEDPEEYEEQDRVLLLEASEIGDFNQVLEISYQKLIENIFTNCSYFDLRNEDGDNCLILASRNGHEQIVSFLMSLKDVKIDAINSIGSNALIEAAENNHLAVVRLLLIDGRIDPNHIDQDGFCCLLTAAGHGYTEIVKELLMDHRTSPNVFNSNYDTSLHYACSNGHLETVKILYYSRRDTIYLNARNSDNYTPLLEAVRNGHTEVVQFLLYCPEINLQGDCYIHYACVYGYIEIVKILCKIRETPLNLFNKNMNGRTLLIETLFSGHYGHYDVFNFLIKNSRVYKIES